MPGKKIGYKRVSTPDQNPDRQLENMELDRVYIEYASGSNYNRPLLKQMIDYIRDEDIVYVHSIDRIARNLQDLMKIIDTVISKGAQMIFIKENLTFNGSDCHMSRLLLQIFGAVAEFEYGIIRERQQEGIEKAKKLGRYAGRKKCLKPEQMDWIREEIKTRRPRREIAAELGICRHTLYKYIARL